ncbi:DUF397 domain-containing protein [Kibdelosporangium aridum]|uniref:DUF397 domain-containing protein n=1 Tax=Kibdelosporangium aridum TaxID=2030 RepID=A0A1W2FWD7_KIBAR|nr:DUF397 domain-containing protein [Kibdelosporangium aridum]SMD26211.1 protein of unknown function [Kibdelosporangium aridum]
MRENVEFECGRSGEWRVSSFCQPGSCVEVKITPAGVLVRDSKVDAGPVLVFTDEEWIVFIAGVRAGEFDIG